MTRKEALKYAKFRLECYSKGDGEYTEHGEFLVAAIEALQEPERKKGQWEEIRNAYGEIEGWTCTCGREVKCKYNYCPNCGADMRGEHG